MLLNTIFLQNINKGFWLKCEITAIGWYVIFGPGAYKNNYGKKSDVKTPLGFQKIKFDQHL